MESESREGRLPQTVSRVTSFLGRKWSVRRWRPSPPSNGARERYSRSRTARLPLCRLWHLSRNNSGTRVTTARARLEPLYPDAYAEYDVLAQRDARATRTARMENIVGAIHNNLQEIPELQDRIRSLVKEWDS